MLCSDEHEGYILEDVPPAIFSGFNDDILPRLRPGSRPHIRLPGDSVPDERILVFRYVKDVFFSLVRKAISPASRKQILKASLRGLADLHDQDVVHLDVNPDNILVDLRDSPSDSQVQLADLENAAYLPPGRCIKGMLAGNEDWRSPEAHFKGELNKHADVFSFGAVCINAMQGPVIFGRDADMTLHESRGALPMLIRLQRQVSYFGDKEGLNGLMKHVGDEEINCQILSFMWDQRSAENILCEPLTDWQDAGDENFKDLIGGMMNLDPTKRTTARKDLEHAWFQGYDQQSTHEYYSTKAGRASEECCLW